MGEEMGGAKRSRKEEEEEEEEPPQRRVASRVPTVTPAQDDLGTFTAPSKDVSGAEPPGDAEHWGSMG